MMPAVSVTKVRSRVFWAVWKDGFAVPLPKKAKTPPTETGWSDNQSKAYKAVFRRYGSVLQSLPRAFARAVHDNEILPTTKKTKKKRHKAKKTKSKRKRKRKA